MNKNFFSVAAYKANAAFCGAIAKLCGKIAKHPNLAMICAGFLMAQGAFAQTGKADYSQGVNALNSVQSGLGSWIAPVRKVCYVVAGIIAIVGGLSVAIKMNNGEQDVKKSIMLIVGAVIFLLAAATALPLMLGVTDTGVTK